MKKKKRKVTWISFSLNIGVWTQGLLLTKFTTLVLYHLSHTARPKEAVSHSWQQPAFSRCLPWVASCSKILRLILFGDTVAIILQLGQSTNRCIIQTWDSQDLKVSHGEMLCCDLPHPILPTWANSLRKGPTACSQQTWGQVLAQWPAHCIVLGRSLGLPEPQSPAW
jgi:hypothetical protein